MYSSKEELDAHIEKRLELYQNWKEGDDRAHCVGRVEHWVRFSKKCEGLIEALCTNFMGDPQMEDVFRALQDWDRDLKEAYDIMMEGIEGYCKGRRVWIPE